MKSVDRWGTKSMSMICDAYAQVFPYYCNYKLFPKSADQYNSAISSKYDTSELAIVFQGPLECKEHFTLETVKLYQKIFPNAHMIISTWEDAPQGELKLLEDQGCALVLNKIFSKSGLSNVNYQICTSLNGIKKAQSLGAKYVIKNRADLRICKNHAFDFMRNLMELFPLKKNEGEVNPTGRILCLSGHAFVPNFLNDLFYFGHIEDLVSYFQVQYDERPEKKADVYLKSLYGDNFDFNGRDIAKALPPEVYLTVNYLRQFMECPKTVEDYWKAVRSYFIMLDFEELDMVWPKYKEHHLMNLYDIKNGQYKLDEYMRWNFSNFVNVYSRSIVESASMDDMAVNNLF